MTWQPDGWNDDMSEAPKDGTLVLAYWPKRRNGDGEEVGGFGIWDDTLQDLLRWVDCDDEATHWRYLPSPPSKQED